MDGFGRYNELDVTGQGQTKESSESNRREEILADVGWLYIQENLKLSAVPRW